MNFYALIDCICGTPSNILEERNESLSGKHGETKALFVNVVFILESFLLHHIVTRRTDGLKIYPPVN